MPTQANQSCCNRTGTWPSQPICATVTGTSRWSFRGLFKGLSSSHWATTDAINGYIKNQLLKDWRRTVPGQTACQFISCSVFNSSVSPCLGVHQIWPYHDDGMFYAMQKIVIDITEIVMIRPQMIYWFYAFGWPRRWFFGTSSLVLSHGFKPKSSNGLDPFLSHRGLEWNDRDSMYKRFLVGGWAAPLKNMSLSIGMMIIPFIYGKIKNGNQTTNQDLGNSMNN